MNFRKHKCFQVTCFKRIFYFVGQTIVRNDKTILRLFNTQTLHHLPGKIVLLYKGGWGRASVTPAALLWKIAAEAIQIVLLYTPATNEHLPPRQTREAVIEIINWKNLDVHYGFLVISLLLGRVWLWSWRYFFLR